MSHRKTIRLEEKERDERLEEEFQAKKETDQARQIDLEKTITVWIFSDFDFNSIS
jgi:hypothetical protein